MRIVYGTITPVNGMPFANGVVVHVDRMVVRMALGWTDAGCQTPETGPGSFSDPLIFYLSANWADPLRGCPLESVGALILKRTSWSNVELRAGAGGCMLQNIWTLGRSTTEADTTLYFTGPHMQPHPTFTCGTNQLLSSVQFQYANSSLLKYVGAFGGGILWYSEPALHPYGTVTVAGLSSSSSSFTRLYSNGVYTQDNSSSLQLPGPIFMHVYGTVIPPPPPPSPPSPPFPPPSLLPPVPALATGQAMFTPIDTATDSIGYQRVSSVLQRLSAAASAAAAGRSASANASSRGGSSSAFADAEVFHLSASGWFTVFGALLGRWIG